MLGDAMAKFHFWVTFTGAYLIFFPMHYLGLMGLPRRYFETEGIMIMPESGHSLNAFISIMAFIVGFAQLVFVFNLIWSLRHGKPSGPNHGGPRRWNGRRPPPRRRMAIGAITCPMSIAGPMITACPAPRRISFPRTSPAR